MPVRDEKDFSYIDMSRAVEGPGIIKFLGAVDYHSREIFGNDQSGIVVIPGHLDEDARINSSNEDYLSSELEIKTVGSPRFKVYDAEDIRFTLLHRRQPKELNKTSRLLWAGRRTTRIQEQTYHPIDVDTDQAPLFKTSPLYEALVRIGLQYDVPSQDNVPIKFSAITLNPDSDFGDKGIELALIPSPDDKVTRMLVDQIQLCYTALKQKSKWAVYPNNGPLPLTVPFARLPRDVTESEIKQFIKVMDENLLPVRGVLSVINPRPTIHN
ncbi:MAG: hypothetical protein WCJ24_00220 [Candidatus Saccharibacteria bacterium]